MTLDHPPEWIVNLTVPTGEQIRAAREELVDPVRAHLMKVVAAKDYRHIQDITANDLYIAIDEPEAKEDQWERRQNVPLEVVSGMRGKIVPQWLHWLRGNRLLHPRLHEPDTLAILAQITQESRTALADAMARRFCIYWGQEVPQRFSLKNPEGQKGNRMEHRFEDDLRAVHERILRIGNTQE